jgi:protein required for attachment to host cells
VDSAERRDVFFGQASKNVAPTNKGKLARAAAAHARAGTNRHSSMAATDWHDLEEHKFAREVAGALETMMRSNHAPALVIVAPTRTLAELRQVFHDDVKKKIIAEVEKDLTKHPVYEIEKLLTAM